MRYLTGHVNFTSIAGILGAVFWFWMLYDCYRNDPHRGLWLWVIIILNLPGALIYFVARRAPSLDLPLPAYFKRKQRADELAQLEARAQNIGNALQHVELGDLQRHLDLVEEAFASYEAALKKEPDEPRALWGAGEAAAFLGRREEARKHLEKLLATKPRHEQGEAHTVYGELLVVEEQFEAAREHLEKDLEHYQYPRLYVLLARALIGLGRPEEAVAHLDTVIRECKTAPAFYYREHKAWIRQATRLRRSLEK